MAPDGLSMGSKILKYFQIGHHHAVQLEVHPFLTPTHAEASIPRNWFQLKDENMTEVEQLLKDVLTHYLELSDQASRKPKHAKHFPAQECLVGPSLRIGFTFRHKPETQVLLSKKSDKSSGHRSSQINHAKLIVFVCPRQHSSRENVSHVFNELLKESTPSDTVEISSYFKKIKKQKDFEEASTSMTASVTTINSVSTCTPSSFNNLAISSKAKSPSEKKITTTCATDDTKANDLHPLQVSFGQIANNTSKTSNTYIGTESKSKSRDVTTTYQHQVTTDGKCQSKQESLKKSGSAQEMPPSEGREIIRKMMRRQKKLKQKSLPSAKKVSKMISTEKNQNIATFVKKRTSLKSPHLRKLDANCSSNPSITLKHKSYLGENVQLPQISPPKARHSVLGVHTISGRSNTGSHLFDCQIKSDLSTVKTGISDATGHVLEDTKYTGEDFSFKSVRNKRKFKFIMDYQSLSSSSSSPSPPQIFSPKQEKRAAVSSKVKKACLRDSVVPELQHYSSTDNIEVPYSSPAILSSPGLKKESYPKSVANFSPPSKKVSDVLSPPKPLLTFQTNRKAGKALPSGHLDISINRNVKNVMPSEKCVEPNLHILSSGPLPNASSMSSNSSFKQCFKNHEPYLEPEYSNSFCSDLDLPDINVPQGEKDVEITSFTLNSCQIQLQNSSSSSLCDESELPDISIEFHERPITQVHRDFGFGKSIVKCSTSEERLNLKSIGSLSRSPEKNSKRLVNVCSSPRSQSISSCDSSHSRFTSSRSIDQQNEGCARSWSKSFDRQFFSSQVHRDLRFVKSVVAKCSASEKNFDVQSVRSPSQSHEDSRKLISVCASSSDSPHSSFTSPQLIEQQNEGCAQTWSKTKVAELISRHSELPIIISSERCLDKDISPEVCLATKNPKLSISETDDLDLPDIILVHDMTVAKASRTATEQSSLEQEKTNLSIVRPFCSSDYQSPLKLMSGKSVGSSFINVDLTSVDCSPQSNDSKEDIPCSPECEMIEELVNTGLPHDSSPAFSGSCYPLESLVIRPASSANKRRRFSSGNRSPLSDLPGNSKSAAPQNNLHEDHLNSVLQLSDEELEKRVLMLQKDLRAVYNGKLHSQRHVQYMEGGNRRRLLDKQVHLQLFREGHEDVVMDALLKIFPNSQYRNLDYLMRVMLPEALMRIYKQVTGFSWEKRLQEK